VNTNYSKNEKLVLVAVAGLGFFLNMVFLYCLFFDSASIWDAFQNPVSLVFIVETFLLLGLLSYLLKKWNLIQIHWIWLVVLSLAGSMAFALPAALLWKNKTE